MRGLGTPAVVVLLLTTGMAGCIGSDQTTGEDEQVEGQSVNATVNGTVETDLLEGEVVFSLATPAVSFNGNIGPSEGPFMFELARPSSATGYVLELAWDAATPASERLDIWVRDASTGSIPPEDPTQPLADPPVATATGTSPVTLVVEEADLAEDADYNLIVRAPSDMGAGATIKQPFDLHVSTFIDQPVDEEHSALE